jgi:hypothetical protein
MTLKGQVGSNIQAAALSFSVQNETKDRAYSLFVGTNAMVAKIDASSMKVVATTSGHPKFAVTALTIGRDPFVYVAASDDNARFSIMKLTQVDLKVQGQYHFEAQEHAPYSLTGDVGHVYSGLYSFPATILKISKLGMNLSKTLVLSEGENDARWVYASGDLLFVTCNTAPGQVVTVQKSTMQRVGVSKLEYGENNPISGAVPAATGDLPTLFVGTNTAPGRVVKLRLGPCTDASTHQCMKRVQATKLDAEQNENYVVSLATDNTFVYAALYKSPARIVRLRQSDLSRAGAVQLQGNENKATVLAYLAGSSLFFAGLDMDPGGVVKLSGYRDWALPNSRRLGSAGATNGKAGKKKVGGNKARPGLRGIVPSRNPQ